jgi:hypothetical protein
MPSNYFRVGQTVLYQIPQGEIVRAQIGWIDSDPTEPIRVDWVGHDGASNSHHVMASCISAITD